VKIYHYTEEIDRMIETLKKHKKTIGFVPTMGALHQGHLSLIEKAFQQNDVAVVSIFVNPTQFNNKEDLKEYPRTLERDVELLQTVSNDIIVFAPTVEDIYGESISSIHFQFDGLEYEMEGKFRQGHFDGVATIVKRLFEIIQPTTAYFGKKDFQQLRIVQKLVKNHQMPVKIVGCEIFREKDGLAMSSRNVRLKEEYRSAAPFIYKTLKEAKKKFVSESAQKVTEWVNTQFSKHALLKLEYFIIADEESLKTVRKKSKTKSYRAFIAVFADKIRLIDNLALK
jgi:pantoate--beta-alanine ligase